jgi:uncharacterized protein
MHLEGKYLLKAPQAQVWDFVSKPEEIAKCLPDLQSFEMKNSHSFTVTVKVGISFVRGNFKFDFTLLDQNPPSHSRFEAIGKGAGVSVRLSASMDLKVTEDGGTELEWQADAEMGGLLGEISPSLIQGSTSRFTQQFFDCVKSKLESSG